MSKIGCEILEITPERIKFVLNNCDVSLANSLRRILLAEVPTLAPHLVNVYENTSVLHDQFLTQRIGLIPFNSEKVDKFQYPWNCDCSAENIDDCQVCKNYFRLQVHNKDEAIREVTSLDIEPVFESMDIMTEAVKPVQFKSSIQKNKVVGIPIVKLAKNQQVNLRFDVQKGIGKMHAKWSPVSLATFQPDSDIKINDQVEATLEEKYAIKESCPAGVFEVQNNALEALYPEKCIFCGECVMKAESINMAKFKNYIKIGKKDNRFIFTVESIGSMPASMIVKSAMRVLRQKLEFIQSLIN